MRQLRNATLALGVERVVDDKLTRKNLVIAEAERAETMRNPTQAFTRGMRLRWARIGGTNDLCQKAQRRVVEAILFENGVEGNILTVMPELTIRHIENSSVPDLRPVSFARQKNKVRAGIDEFFDQPRASHAIDLYATASDPLHEQTFSNSADKSKNWRKAANLTPPCARYRVGRVGPYARSSTRLSSNSLSS